MSSSHSSPCRLRRASRCTSTSAAVDLALRVVGVDAAAMAVVAAVRAAAVGAVAAVAEVAQREADSEQVASEVAELDTATAAALVEVRGVEGWREALKVVLGVMGAVVTEAWQVAKAVEVVVGVADMARVGN